MHYVRFPRSRAWDKDWAHVTEVSAFRRKGEESRIRQGKKLGKTVVSAGV